MILVVDDDRELRELLCDMLQDEGYDVVGARNGLEALNALRAADRVCVVFLDLMMPGMSGYEFREHQKSDPKLANIPVVAMSARWEGRQEIDVRDFMRKPVIRAALLGFAERYCADERRNSA